MNSPIATVEFRAWFNVFAHRKIQMMITVISSAVLSPERPVKCCRHGKSKLIMLHTTQESVPVGNADNLNKRKPFDVFANIFRRKSKELDSDASDIRDDTYGSTEYSHVVIANDTSPPRNRSRSESTPTNIEFGRSSPSHGSRCSSRSPASPRVRSLEDDMEALRLSRQDNPYIQQKLEGYSVYGDFSPSSLYPSPQKYDQQKLVADEEVPNITDIDYNLHEHLIRSPPPQFPKKISQFVFQSRTGSPQNQSREVSMDITDDDISHSSLPFTRDTKTLMKTKGSLSLGSVNENIQKKDAKKNKDLNPLTKKAGTGALDPSVRQVLEFQKQILFPDQRIDVSSPVEIKRASDLSLSPQRSHSLTSKSWSNSSVSRSVSFPTATSTNQVGLNNEAESRGHSLAPVKAGRMIFGGQSMLTTHSTNDRHHLSNLNRPSQLDQSSSQDMG